MSVVGGTRGVGPDDSQPDLGRQGSSRVSLHPSRKGGGGDSISVQGHRDRGPGRSDDEWTGCLGEGFRTKRRQDDGSTV